MYNLDGKVAIVTGSGRPHGIGRGIALRLALEGAAVVIADIGKGDDRFPEQGVGMKEDMAARVAEIEALGRRALAVEVDVSVGAEVDRMVKRTLEHFGRIDILVNNVGIGLGGPTLEVGEERWSRVFDVNAKGTFLCSVAVAKEMIRQGWGGKIVSTASQAAKVGGTNRPRPLDAPISPYNRANLSPLRGGLAAYSASKAAIVTFTRTFAMELGPYGINVNAVCPGWVETDPMIRGFGMQAEALGMSVKEYTKQFVAQTIPLGRMETPDDVANLVAFLCSSESDYMTGQAINITGGTEMH